MDEVWTLGKCSGLQDCGQKQADSGATALIEPKSGRWASLMRVTHVSRGHSTKSSRFCCYCGVAVQVTGRFGSFLVQLVKLKLFASDWLPAVTLIFAEVYVTDSILRVQLPFGQGFGLVWGRP
jgi:hypothetical protein